MAQVDQSGPQLTVFSTTAIKAVLDALAPSFEGAAGARLKLEYGPSGRMAKLVAEGAATDVAIVTGGGIDELVPLKRIVAGSRSDIARSLIGMAVPLDAPAADIANVESFRRTLLAARRIAMSNPTGGAQSGAHLAKVFERLGIAQQLKDKLMFGPGGPAGLVGNFLLRGEADIGLQQMPELLAVPGIQMIGPIPGDVQLATTFSAGISTASANPTLAQAFIRHLVSADAARAITDAGMEPAWNTAP